MKNSSHIVSCLFVFFLFARILAFTLYTML